jgi:3-hydroxymyristoyl/3-hydroxydecanoyl-(acyl carrier protein) dehydratase
MKATDYEILDLIPQRPPMQMIDKLMHADERSATGSLYIQPNNLFCENGFLREPGILEFIAQTAAAFTGYRKKLSQQDVTEGYIGAIKNLVVSTLPSANHEIRSEIVVENEIVGFTIVSGKVFDENQVIASCEMRILLNQ